jgi:hypothetical protein
MRSIKKGVIKLLGFSVYLNENISDHDVEGYKKLAEAGFDGIFTSLHIPEENPDYYDQRLKYLLETAKQAHLKVMIDISKNALEAIGLSTGHPQAILDYGIHGLRMDEGFPLNEIADLSRYLTIALNASTLTEGEMKELRHCGADLHHLEAWHNFYPRPETGLDDQWFLEKNSWLQKEKVKVVAFAPGSGQLRGPLYQTLPTLESHRRLNPLASTLSLLRHFKVNQVYIGDPGLSSQSFEQFSHFFEKGRLLLHATTFDPQWDSLVYRQFTNRPDEARDVVRCQPSRMLNKDKNIKSGSTTMREKGMITIDNNLYGRYKGEIQIVKRSLAADPKVNLIGKIIDEDIPLVHWIHGGTPFQIVKGV